MMAYQPEYTILFVILSLAFIVSVVGNVLLAVTIVKLKREKEWETPDRRRHFDVLFTALAAGNVLGSCLNYPLLFYLYTLASKEKDIPGHVCDILGSSTLFYFSYIAILTLSMLLHSIASSTWPFRYYIYLRKTKSKIPLLCITASVSVAVVSLTLSASGFSLFDLTQGTYFNNITTCVPDILHITTSKYYYMIVGHLFFWTHLSIFIITTWQCVKMKNADIGQVIGDTDWFGLPRGSSFKMTRKLIYLLFWTPFIIVMTIVTCSSYHITTEVIVTVCYLMFIPGLLGPFAFYVTHADLRETFNTSIQNLISGRCRRGQQIERQNVEQFELHYY